MSQIALGNSFEVLVNSRYISLLFYMRIQYRIEIHIVNHIPE